MDVPVRRASELTRRETEVDLHLINKRSNDGLRGHIANITEHGICSREEIEFAVKEKTLLDIIAVRTIDQFESRVI